MFEALRFLLLVTACLLPAWSAAKGQDVVDTIKSSNVSIEIYDPDAKEKEYGTGFFVSNEGLHPHSEPFVGWQKNVTINIKIKSLSGNEIVAMPPGDDWKSGDLVLLKISADANGIVPVVLTDPSCIDRSTTLLSAGFGNGSENHAQGEFHLSSKDPGTSVVRQGFVPFGSWSVTPGFSHGASGSPLFSSDGGVLGVVDAGDEPESSGLFIPILQARGLLDKIGVGIDKCDPKPAVAPTPDPNPGRRSLKM